jgi:hypothetical protein
MCETTVKMSLARTRSPSSHIIAGLVHAVLHFEQLCDYLLRGRNVLGYCREFFGIHASFR